MKNLHKITLVLTVIVSFGIYHDTHSENIDSIIIYYECLHNGVQYASGNNIQCVSIHSTIDLNQDLHAGLDPESCGLSAISTVVSGGSTF